MKFAVKSGISKKGFKFYTIGCLTADGRYKSLGLLKPFDVAYLLNLTAREAEDLVEGVYIIE